MKNNTLHKKYKLGLFVLIGLSFFFILIFLIGSQKNLFTKEITLSTTFKNVSGLKVGNSVRFSGINVGSVNDIVIINDTTVKVDIKLKSNVQEFIKKDSKAFISSEGVIGDKILVVSQGSSESKEVKNGDLIKSYEPVEFDDILGSIKVSADNAQVITEELAVILIKINEGEGSLGKLINDESMANNLDKTLNNIESSTQKLDENMEAAKHNFLLRGYFKKKEREKQKAADKAKEDSKN